MKPGDDNKVVRDQHLVNISKYWAAFTAQLEKWMEEDRATPELPLSTPFNMEEYKVRLAQYNLEKNAAIKKHISSTHTWIKGKMHWSKKSNNGYQSPFECTACGIGASSHERLGWSETEYRVIDFENGEIPSGDMHGQRLHRTCQEVQAARDAHRKSHKGGKCVQCGTYKCHFKDY